MCGISGVVNIGSAQTLRVMNDKLVHRGPDGEGSIWFEELNGGFAHRRLSIIDLSPGGAQPMKNDSGTLWITFNGEIYNYRELRKELESLGVGFRSSSDTEVLLKAFEKWGVECLQKLNGMFAFAIADLARKSVILARDRIGVKPLYYARVKDALVFSSEIKAILATGLVEKSPDYHALHTPTRYQISPFTGFRNILKVPPASYLIFRNGDASVRQYWSIAPSEDASPSFGNRSQELDDLLNDAVRLQMVADVPVGVLLSGGLDSSIVSALMKKNTDKEIHSFTIKFDSQDQRFEKMVDDSSYAKRVAETFGFDHHEIVLHPDVVALLPKLVYHLDEPLSDPASINTYLISQAARELGIKVLLNGMGGDEIFGGYRKQLACLRSEIYQEIFPRLVRQFIERVSDHIPVATDNQGFRLARWGKRFLSFASLPEYERFIASDLSMTPAQYRECFLDGGSYDSTYYFTEQKTNFEDPDLSYLTKMCLNDTRVFLPEHNLLYSDKACMAAGLEGRPPFSDHRLVEFMFTLPMDYRIHGNVQKYLLKRVSERYLNKEVIYRPKAPFGSPLRSWIRGALAPMVNDLLSEESLRKDGIYNSRYVRQLIENDRAGKEDNAQILWTLLTNVVWLRTFFG